MKQNNNIKTDAANNAKSTRECKAITADRATKADPPASKSHLLKLKKLIEAWMEARESGAAEALLETGSEWQQLLQAAGLSVIDGQADIASDARAAAETVAARYEAAKTVSARKALPIVVDIITQPRDKHKTVPVDEALNPLVPQDAVPAPELVWSNFAERVRGVPSKDCDLRDLVLFVSARDVLSVEEIAARIPSERKAAALNIQRKVRSVLMLKSPAYRAFSAADLRAVKTRGSQVVHVVDVKYTTGAAGKAQ